MCCINYNKSLKIEHCFLIFFPKGTKWENSHEIGKNIHLICTNVTQQSNTHMLETHFADHHHRFPIGCVKLLPQIAKTPGAK